MDYENLIEQLKQKDGLWCSVPTGEKLVTDAADALSTLQAENEKRQAELEEMTQRNDENLGMCRIWEYRYTELQAENEELKEKLYDGEGVNLVNYWMQQAKIEENGHRNCQAALERAKEEITRLKHYEDKCHDCPIVCAKTEIIKAHEELEAVQAELEQVKRELQAYKDTGLEPEDFKRAFHEDAVLKLAGQALGIASARLRELAQADREGRVHIEEKTYQCPKCGAYRLTPRLDKQFYFCFNCKTQFTCAEAEAALEGMKNG